MRTPRVQRLWADLCINYALYVNLDSTYRLPLRRVVGWPIGEKEKIAVLYGLPGAVIWIPFYEDWPLDQVLYSNIANGIQQLNPHLPTTPQIVDCILSHVLKNEYREEPEEAIPSRLENVRTRSEEWSVVQAMT